MMQRDLYGNAVEKVGVKDPDGVRQYPMSSRTITLIDSVALKTGLPKAEVVATSIELYATMISMVPAELIEMIKSGQMQNLFAQSI